jgi:hypothetical protein
MISACLRSVASCHPAVVASEDAVLVTHRSRASDLKQLNERLKAEMDDIERFDDDYHRA